MMPTALTLFFVQELLNPANLQAWKKILKSGVDRARYAANPEKGRAYSAGYALAFPEKRRAYSAGYALAFREKHRATSAAYRLNNPEKIKITQEKNRDVRRITRRERRASDPTYKLLLNCRTRISQALKLNTKGAKTRELIGCTIEELRAHLEKQFRPGMTWENRGPVWHIDHIRPCASFDLANPAQQFECFNWSNCQPLFAAENLQKGDHYVPNP